MLNLAIIRQRYDPFGGAERFVSLAAATMREHGTQTTIISRKWSGDSTRSAWMRCDPFYLGRIWRDRGFAREACRLVAAHGFDLVQSHERIPCCDIYRAGDGVHAQWLTNRSRAFGRLRRLGQAINPFHWHLLAAERKLFSSSRLRAVICNSAMVRDEISRLFPLVAEKLHVIYNGVDLSRFHTQLSVEHRLPMRRQLGIPPNEKVLIFVGAGFERKGVRVLLDAMSRLSETAISLVVVGKDRRASRYVRQAETLGLSEKVHWVGPQTDVTAWYGMADIFVLPTLYDPFSNAALEALATGLPVVTTRQCGTAEIIREGWNGFVCEDPADPVELANKLKIATETSSDMRINARKSAEKFGLEDMALVLAELYASLMMEPYRAT